MSKINFNITKVEFINPNYVRLEGLKLPPPSKRITLHQANIKVSSAKIIYKNKKGDIEFEVSRVNHLKSFGEVRLHANNVMYPGAYVVEIEFKGKLDEEILKKQA
jgi:hypothetical protein